MPAPKIVQRLVAFLTIMLMIGAWIVAWVDVSTHPDALLHGAVVFAIFGVAVAIFLGEPHVT